MSTGCQVIVPLRSFADPMTRLADVLSVEERVELTTTLARAVLEAVASWPTAVVTDDPAVARWSASLGTDVITPGRPGLNASVTAARDAASGAGFDQVAIVHADLSAPERLPDVLVGAATADRHLVVTAVPDAAADGTNVLVVPTGVGFSFGYGPGSFERHRTEAARLGLVFAPVVIAELGWDVDTAEDLAAFRGRTAHVSESSGPGDAGSLAPSTTTHPRR